MTTKIENVTLNDGVKIPAFGFGTFQIPADGSTYQAVKEALKLGCTTSIRQRLILTKPKSARPFAKAAFPGKRSS